MFRSYDYAALKHRSFITSIRYYSLSIFILNLIKRFIKLVQSGLQKYRADIANDGLVFDN